MSLDRAIVFALDLGAAPEAFLSGEGIAATEIDLSIARGAGGQARTAAAGKTSTPTAAESTKLNFDASPDLSALPWLAQSYRLNSSVVLAVIEPFFGYLRLREDPLVIPSMMLQIKGDVSAMFAMPMRSWDQLGIFERTGGTDTWLIFNGRVGQRKGHKAVQADPLSYAPGGTPALLGRLVYVLGAVQPR